MSPADIATQPETATSTATPDVANATAASGTGAPSSSDGPSSSTAPSDLQRALKLEVPVTAVLAERDLTIEAILAISVGTIIEFEVPFDSDLTLRVTNRSIGTGQAVKIGENFGLRIGNIEPVRERIDALGG